MAPSSVLITGSGQRLGLALALLYASRGWRIFAAEHEDVDVDRLRGLSSIRVIPMDVRDQTSITAAAVSLSGGPVDVLIHAATFKLPDGLYELSQRDFTAQLETNCVAPFLVTRAFLPNLQLAVQESGLAKVLTCGFHDEANDFASGGYYGYRTALSALHTLTKLLAADLKSDKIAVVEAAIPNADEGSTDASEMQEMADALIDLICRERLEGTGSVLQTTMNVSLSTEPQ